MVKAVIKSGSIVTSGQGVTLDVTGVSSGVISVGGVGHCEGCI